METVELYITYGILFGDLKELQKDYPGTREQLFSDILERIAAKEDHAHSGSFLSTHPETTDHIRRARVYERR